MGRRVPVPNGRGRRSGETAIRRVRYRHVRQPAASPQHEIPGLMRKKRWRYEERQATPTSTAVEDEYDPSTLGSVGGLGPVLPVAPAPHLRLDPWANPRDRRRHRDDVRSDRAALYRAGPRRAGGEPLPPPRRAVRRRVQREHVSRNARTGPWRTIRTGSRQASTRSCRSTCSSTSRMMSARSERRPPSCGPAPTSCCSFRACPSSTARSTRRSTTIGGTRRRRCRKQCDQRA